MKIFAAYFSERNPLAVDGVAEFESVDGIPDGYEHLPGWSGFEPAPSGGAELRCAAGSLYWHDPRSLDDHKESKRVDINTARLAANHRGFVFSGKRISTDPLSRSDIDGTNGTVTLTGAFPEGWAGFWKAEDNTLIPIPDIPTWRLLYRAMAAQGAANFAISQGLKAQLDAATTIAEVAAVVWPVAPGGTNT